MENIISSDLLRKNPEYKDPFAGDNCCLKFIIKFKSVLLERLATRCTKSLNIILDGFCVIFAY